MKKLLYPSDNFIRRGKILAASLEDFSIEFGSDKCIRYVEDLRFFLFEDGREVGVFRFCVAFFSMLPFLVVHFFSLGLGGKASYISGVVTYNF